MVSESGYCIVKEERTATLKLTLSIKTKIEIWNLCISALGIPSTTFSLKTALILKANSNKAKTIVFNGHWELCQSSLERGQLKMRCCGD
jgi:hypothetical protein